MGRMGAMVGVGGCERVAPIGAAAASGTTNPAPAAVIARVASIAGVGGIERVAS